METTTQTLPEYLAELGVNCKATPIDTPASAPEWARDSHHQAWRVSLTRNGKKIIVQFYTGSAITAPTTADIIYALVMDHISGSLSLDEFGDEFGWDKHTLSTWRACRKNGSKLVKILDEQNINAIADMGY
jgi:hypothetical protein